jgi:hypothetical protein
MKADNHNNRSCPDTNRAKSCFVPSGVGPPQPCFLQKLRIPMTAPAFGCPSARPRPHLPITPSQF